MIKKKKKTNLLIDCVIGKRDRLGNISKIVVNYRERRRKRKQKQKRKHPPTHTHTHTQTDKKKFFSVFQKFSTNHKTEWIKWIKIILDYIINTSTLIFVDEENDLIKSKMIMVVVVVMMMIFENYHSIQQGEKKTKRKKE